MLAQAIGRGKGGWRSKWASWAMHWSGCFVPLFLWKSHSSPPELTFFSAAAELETAQSCEVACVKPNPVGDRRISHHAAGASATKLAVGSAYPLCKTPSGLPVPKPSPQGSSEVGLPITQSLTPALLIQGDTLLLLSGGPCLLLLERVKPCVGLLCFQPSRYL